MNIQGRYSLETVTDDNVRQMNRIIKNDMSLENNSIKNRQTAIRIMMLSHFDNNTRYHIRHYCYK